MASWYSYHFLTLLMWSGKIYLVEHRGPRILSMHLFCISSAMLKNLCICLITNLIPCCKNDGLFDVAVTKVIAACISPTAEHSPSAQKLLTAMSIFSCPYSEFDVSIHPNQSPYTDAAHMQDTLWDFKSISASRLILWEEVPFMYFPANIGIFLSISFIRGG